jgi:hypothetical protein
MRGEHALIRRIWNFEQASFDNEGWPNPTLCLVNGRKNCRKTTNHKQGTSTGAVEVKVRVHRSSFLPSLPTRNTNAG